MSLELMKVEMHLGSHPRTGCWHQINKKKVESLFSDHAFRANRTYIDFRQNITPNT